MPENSKLTEEKADTLLNICSLLMISGANTNRILLILTKFAKLIDTDAEIFINHKAFIISITDKETGIRTTQVKRLPHHVINFAIISALSRAGHAAEQNHWTFEKIKTEVERIKHIKPYPRIVILLGVSLAGAGFCRLFGGDYLNLAVTFLATLVGLFIRQQSAKGGFNHYLCAFFGALTAAVIAAGLTTFIPGNEPHIAIATSVLFLIPGVPLINSVTDMLDGYIISGTVRFFHGLMFVLAIAFALFIVMYVFNITAL